MATDRLTPPNPSLSLFAQRLVGRVLLYALLVVFALIFCFPFYDMFIGSLMQDSDLFSSKPLIWPTHGIRFEAYVRLWVDYSYGRPLFNTFYLASVRTIGILFFSALAGYTFAKRRFPGRDKLFFLMLGTMMLPSQMTIIPWYLLMTKVLKWTDTYWGFWVPAWASAFGIFWMRQYIATSIPDEMLEAATIDGAGVFGAFIRVVLPLITPGFAVLGILQFVQSSNLFLGPLLLLSDPNKITAPLALANFQQTTRTAPRYAMMFAGSTLATIPLLIVFFAFQRQLISGIMSGAIKG
jgi:ABC-type glycerol-3-phosphate transport system permease component